MMTEMLKGIAEGLGMIVPAFFKALLDGTVALLCTTTSVGSGEAAVLTITGLSAVGQLGITFIILGICYKFLPNILGWLKMGASKVGGAFRQKAKA